MRCMGHVFISQGTCLAILVQIVTASLTKSHTPCASSTHGVEGERIHVISSLFSAATDVMNSSEAVGLYHKLLDSWHILLPFSHSDSSGLTVEQFVDKNLFTLVIITLCCSVIAYLTLVPANFFRVSFDIIHASA